MKTKSILMLLLIIAFDLLFYKQIPGLNIIAFYIMLIVTILIEKPLLIKNDHWKMSLIISLISSFLIGIYGDILAMLTFIISISLLAANTNYNKPSIWVALCSFFITVIKSPFTFFRIEKIKIMKWNKNESHINNSRLKIIAFSLLIFLLFFIIYLSSNLLFRNFVQKINFSFISFSLIIFTIFGLLLIVSFTYYKSNKFLVRILDLSDKQISFDSQQNYQKLYNEQFAGILLFSILNILLLTVNFLDIEFLVNRKLPEGVTYSEFIHQGVGMLIFSIILAIAIILYFFRSNLNFTRNVWLKSLANLWIIQNVFILVSSISRNSMYVNAYGLTEKRIGVYFYIFLAAIGLITTYIKIVKQQSNPYFIRLTTKIFFAVMLVACMINWDNIITRHNLLRLDVDKNFKYLNTLSNTNIPLLLDYTDKNIHSLKSMNNLYKMKYLDSNILQFLQYYNKYSSWQSINYLKYRVYKNIITRKITKIYLENVREKDLEILAQLPLIEEIGIRNSNLFNFYGWQKLKSIKRLSLNNCNIINLSFLHFLNKLEYLNISTNYIKDYYPIFSLKNLKELHIKKINENDLKILKEMLPQTKIFISTL